MVKNLKLIFGFFLLSTLLINLVAAESDHGAEITQGMKLVEAGVDCDTLDEEQLESIGEYLMELRHPGEEHELMDSMMGGEGSESLRLAHIRMAQNIYCRDRSVAMGPGMMGGQGMMSDWGFGSSMMGGYGMMGGFGMFVSILFWIALLVVIVLVIIWLYRKVSAQKGSESATQILEKRYASGEITKKQFEEMKREIREE